VATRSPVKNLNSKTYNDNFSSHIFFIDSKAYKSIFISLPKAKPLFSNHEVRLLSFRTASTFKNDSIIIHPLLSTELQNINMKIFYKIKSNKQKLRKPNTYRAYTNFIRHQILILKCHQTVNKF